MAVQVAREKVVKALQELGSKSADGWDDVRLSGMINAGLAEKEAKAKEKEKSILDREGLSEETKTFLFEVLSNTEGSSLDEPVYEIVSSSNGAGKKSGGKKSGGKAEKKEKGTKKEKGDSSRVRARKASIWDYSVSAVCKWMGANGYDAKQAQKVVDQLAEGEVSSSTVSTGVSDGRSEKYRKGMAELTKKEAAEIKKIATASE